MDLIPISSLAAQTFHVVLNGQNCTISLYWRQRRLFLDLSVNGAVVCRGAVCQNCADVLQSRSPLFSGTLHFFDLEGHRPPHWEGLNTRWMLLYLTDEETIPEKLRY